MVSEMFDKAIQFLKDHKEIALATSEGSLLPCYRGMKGGQVQLAMSHRA